jgi:hypothetical protein
MAIATPAVVAGSAPSFTASVLTLNGQPVTTNWLPRLNNHGDVVADHQTLPNAPIVVWRHGTAGDIVPGTEGSAPFDLNDAGTIVGWGYNVTGAPFGTSGSYAAGYVVGANNAVTYYPLDPNTGTGFLPQAINAAGVIAGAETGVSPAGIHLVGPGVDRTFTVGSGNLRAEAINASNQTVGFSNEDPDGVRCSMFFDDGAITHAYTNLFGMDSVMGVDLTDARVVVGMTEYSTGHHPELGPTDPRYLAFRMLTPGNEAAPDAEILHPLPGSYNSIAQAINESNWIVGLSDDFKTSAATLWLNDGTPYDLNTLTTGLPTGLRLEVATDVNDRGQIVAWATDGFNDYPVLLTPAVPLPTPEPSAPCTLIGLATIGTILRRRHAVHAA